MLATPLLTALASVSLVSAAVVSTRADANTAFAKFVHPPSRGSHKVSSTIGPCQGISIGGRFDFPVSKGGQITLSTTQDISNLQFQYASVKNPQSLSDFTPTGKALSSWGAGSTCMDGPDFSSFNFKNGDEVTVMMTYQSGAAATNYYECVDLTLVSDASYSPHVYTCSNSSVAAPAPSAPSTSTDVTTGSSGSSSCSSSSSSGGMPAAIGGVIGGVITLVVLVGLLAVAWKTGHAAFGKANARRWREQATVLQDVHGSTIHLDQKGSTF